MVLMDEEMTVIHKKVDFSREFGKQFQGKLFEKNQVRELLEKEESLKKLRMSGLSSLANSSKKKKENLAIDYDFDVLLYAGIKKPGDQDKKKILRNKAKRRSKSYRHQKMN
jgi:hypothetical protein